MNKFFKYGLVVLVISLIGFAIYFFGFKPHNHPENSHQTEVYTCPMRQDSVFSDKPGKCPKCGMDLIKIVKENKTVEDHSI